MLLYKKLLLMTFGATLVIRFLYGDMKFFRRFTESLQTNDSTSDFASTCVSFSVYYSS